MRRFVFLFLAMLFVNCRSLHYIEKRNHAQGPQGDVQTPPSAIGIHADHNRNGVLDDGDSLRDGWNWDHHGALMLAELVDANGNKRPDGEDPGPRAPAMLKQFVPLHINLSGPITFSHNGGSHVRVFTKDGQQEISSGSNLVGPVELIIAAKHFAGVDGFSGYVKFTAMGQEASAETTVRVAPWIMLPNSAKPKKLFIAEGLYDGSSTMTSALQSLVDVEVFGARLWQEMWLQDTIEIGYQEVPGKGVHYVALQADRCSDKECDRFAATLLSAEFGIFRIPAQPRKGYGQWDDWLGNLEVSPPTKTWPLGRIFIGKNLNENLAQFLHMQEVQKPFVLDPTWLKIKHVDEFLNFIQDEHGQAKIMIASPRKASQLDGLRLDGTNESFQKRIDTDRDTTLRALSLTEGDVIDLPVLYTADGQPLWSSPVNSVQLGKNIAVGNSTEGSPGTLATTSYGRDIQRTFAEVGLQVAWVNDYAYHSNSGNVHCGTNVLREPVVKEFWRFSIKK